MKMQRSGLTEIIFFDRRFSYLRPVSCVFTAWVSSGLMGSPLEVTVLADDCDILCFYFLNSLGGGISDSSERPLQRDRRGYYHQCICDKGEEWGACSHAHILQKFAAGLPKVTTTHEEQTSPWRILVFFLDMRRCKNWAHKNFSPKISTYLKICSASFPRAHSASLLTSTVNSTQGVWQVSSCSGSWVNPCRSIWQVMASGNFQFTVLP